MPLAKPPMKKGALGSKTDLIMQEVKVLMKRRRKLHLELLTLQEENDKVFDELATINSESQVLETQIKDLVRKLYKEGSQRGIFVVHEDDTFRIKATVKYGRDYIETEELMKKLPGAAKLPSLIELDPVVDVATFKKYIEEERIPKTLESLIRRGEFKTPQVTIQDKTKEEHSFTEEAE